MPAEAVEDIFNRILALSERDRELLERRLEERRRAEWDRAAADARRLAAEKGLDEEAVDRAVAELRYGEGSRP